MNRNLKCILKILSGAHAEATVELINNQPMLIGSADDCDIMLSDAGIAKRHCLILRSDAGISIRAIEGECHISDGIIHTGESHNHPNFVEMDISNIKIVTGDINNIGWSLLGKDKNPKPAGTINKIFGKFDSHKQAAIIGLLGSICLISMFATTFFVPVKSSSKNANLSLLRPMAMMPNFLHVEFSKDMKGTLFVSGFVETGDDLAQLRDKLDASNFSPYVLSVRVLENVADQLATLMRVKGAIVDPKVQYLGLGKNKNNNVIKIRINDIDKHLTVVNKLLASSEFANHNPQILLVGAGTKPAVNTMRSIPKLSDKKPIQAPVVNTIGAIVTMIQSDYGQCVTTSDQNRYYVGNILPNGSVIIQIKPNVVVVKQEDQIYEVKAGEHLYGGNKQMLVSIPKEPLSNAIQVIALK